VEEGVVIFVTMFLSLTAGVHPVDVEVTGPAARVEIVLDGTVRQLQSPPGAPPGLRTRPPYVLQAIAFDAENREIGRAGSSSTCRGREPTARSRSSTAGRGQRYAGLLCRSFLGRYPSASASPSTTSGPR
jgi:hypothetical protein